MSNPRYVWAHGRRILVETRDPPSGVKRRKARQEAAFALVPLAHAAEVTRRMKSKGTMVWIVLVYLAWKNKSPTVQLSNEIMRHYGITRHVKYRALATLETAGIIAVEWRNKQAPMVTLIQR